LLCASNIQQKGKNISLGAPRKVGKN